MPKQIRKQKMKSIAYLTPTFPVLSETFVGTEIRAMANQGHSITSISFSQNQGLAQTEDLELSKSTIYLNQVEKLGASKGFKYLTHRSLAGIKFAYKQKSLPTRSLLYSGLKIAAIVGARKCQHIHAHFAQSTASSAIVAARFLNIGVSFVGHGHDVYTSPSDLALKLKEVDLAIAVCEDMVNDYSNMVVQSNIGLVYCGVDLKSFHTRSIDSKSNRKFLFIGRLVEYKGIEDIIEAVSTIPIDQRPRIDLVGEGELREKLQLKVNHHNLNPWITFLGARTQEWIRQNGPSYMALVGAFKPAKDGSRDTGPVVVKEAMAMGLPVVTTNFMGCKEMITSQCGIKVAPGDSLQLGNAMKKINSMNEQELRKMGEHGRERVASLYTADHQAQKLSALIEAI